MTSVVDFKYGSNLWKFRKFDHFIYLKENKMKKLILSLIMTTILTLTACSTPYQERGLRGALQVLDWMILSLKLHLQEMGLLAGVLFIDMG